jgi:hypothetical protein
LAATLAKAMMGVSWLWILGGFMLASWLATRAAHMAESKAVQYAALAGYVAAQAIIFVPLLYIAQTVAPGAIESATLVTFLGFAALTALVFITRKDFIYARFSPSTSPSLPSRGCHLCFQLGTFFRRHDRAGWRSTSTHRMSCITILMTVTWPPRCSFSRP